MTRDKFQDAMNLLADDLIEEVDVLRAQKKRRASIIRYLSLAACVCLVAGSALAWGHMNSKISRDGVKEESSSPVGPEHNLEQTMEQDDVALPEAEAENSALDKDTQKAEDSVAMQVTLKVEELFEKGFVGSVTEEGEFPEGTRIQVYVLQGEYVEYKIGSVVSVEYEDKSFAESAAQYVIYAEEVILIEGSEAE